MLPESDSKGSVIYGLEFQARSLAAQVAETEKIRFFVGTQSLKQANNNQIHLVEFDEESLTLKTFIYCHPRGEIWKLNASPSDARLLLSCYNTFSAENTCCKKCSLLRLPEDGKSSGEVNESLQEVVAFDTESISNEIKTSEFHPSRDSQALTVTDDKLVLWDLGQACAKAAATVALEGKNSPKFTAGKWNPHQNGNQFAATSECHVKAYDMRTGGPAWSIDGAHAQLIRDLDFNMNRQYHLATCGDDGFLKIWDARQASEPVLSRSDHSHWVWCVRFNPFHDQLVLTAASDARVLLTSAASVSSEAAAEVADGPLQWAEHEDSVYCVEWSPAEPWTYASLSYDGRLLLSRVESKHKFQQLNLSLGEERV